MTAAVAAAVVLTNPNFGLHLVVIGWQRLKALDSNDDPQVLPLTVNCCYSQSKNRVYVVTFFLVGGDDSRCSDIVAGS